MIFMRRATYVGHELVSADMAKEILNRLKAPSNLIEMVCKTTALHMRMHDIDKIKRPCKVRKLLGKDYIDVVELLVEADEMSALREDGTADVRSPANIAEVRSKFPEMLPKPIINGYDLVGIGMKPGPNFKTILDNIYDLQLDGLEDREKLLSRAPGILKMIENECKR
jgi:tRNA nucleotidyltransferase/poly(A) polymerase